MDHRGHRRRVRRDENKIGGGRSDCKSLVSWLKFTNVAAPDSKKFSTVLSEMLILLAENFNDLQRSEIASETAQYFVLVGAPIKQLNAGSKHLLKYAYFHNAFSLATDFVDSVFRSDSRAFINRSKGWRAHYGRFLQHAT
jgi:hypothetical protein